MTILRLGKQAVRNEPEAIRTESGALASFATFPLVDLTSELMAEWGKVEGAKRPAHARNARTLLSTFLNWWSCTFTYKNIVTSNPAQSPKAKEHLGKPSQKMTRYSV